MFNVGEKYLTRSKKEVIIDGVSEYVIWGQHTRILTGTIDGETYTWNGHGDYLVNRLFLYEDFSDLDLLYSKPMVDNPQVYYFDLVKEKRETFRRRGY